MKFIKGLKDTADCFGRCLEASRLAEAGKIEEAKNLMLKGEKNVI